MTEDGEPVAQVNPLPRSDREALIDAGLLTASTKSTTGPSVPTESLPPGTTTAATLEELRADRV